MRWQRPARVAVAMAGLGCAGALVYYARARPTPMTGKTAVPMEAHATSESSGVQGRRFDLKANKEEMKIDAEREVNSPDRTRFERAHITLTRPDRTVDIWADRADMKGQVGGGEPDQMALDGHVRVKASDGLDLHTDAATYDRATSLATIPGHVTFTRDRMSGEGIGATYDEGRNILWLLDQAHVTQAADPDGGGAIDASAKAIGVARNDKYMRMSENAKLVRDHETLMADTILLHFTDDEKGLQLIEMQGHSAVVPNQGGGDGPPDMRADNINLEFQPDGRTLRHAMLEGTARVVQVENHTRQTIVGNAIDVVTGTDGRTVTNLEAKQNVVVTLPATADAPARTIRAASLVTSGDQGGGLKSAVFDGGVTFEERQAAARGHQAATRTGRSRALALALKGGLGEIQTAEFRRSVVFKDGDMSATADLGEYRRRARPPRPHAVDAVGVPAGRR